MPSKSSKFTKPTDLSAGPTVAIPPSSWIRSSRGPCPPQMSTGSASRSRRPSSNGPCRARCLTTSAIDAASRSPPVRTITETAPRPRRSSPTTGLSGSRFPATATARSSRSSSPSTSLRVKIREDAVVHSKAVYHRPRRPSRRHARRARDLGRADRRREVLDEGVQRPHDARRP